jgi:beta-glucuronidase
MRIIAILLLPVFFTNAFSQTAMTNAEGRKRTSLNGKWQIIIDPYNSGNWMGVWQDKKATGKTDFVEYAFNGYNTLNVPGDYNSQSPELNYYENTIWYKKTFDYQPSGKRLFLHFGAVNYKAEVYLNSKKIGSHEGGFTPFQFEITGVVQSGSNSVIVKINDARDKTSIPAVGYDWFNYGGITRDVDLIETPASFMEDYFIQLQKGSLNTIAGFVKIDGTKPAQKVRIQIPELKIDQLVQPGKGGRATFSFPVKCQLWSPETPKLYTVKLVAETDTISEEIGFRSIEVKGTDILLNGKPIFLKGVNFHEEIPQRRARAYSEADAIQLLTAAKELGCNFVRTAHYPQNEHIVRMAEKMGLMMWEEIPVWQQIAFADSTVPPKISEMLQEMLRRDKNRCGIIIWSMSNETAPGKDRDHVLASTTQLCRSIDSTRLISSAFNHVKYSGDSMVINDRLGAYFDVLAVNEYVGWYVPWPAKPGVLTVTSNFNKPLIMTEFGAEALYGNHGPADTASSWSEEYQEQLYKDQLTMFRKIPFLKGTCPWILYDFRAPPRMHPVFQNGWNRKGLLSEQGYKKKAWYVMKEYYSGL